MSILVIAEHDNSELKPATLNVVTAALKLDATVDVLVVGNNCQGIADQAAKVSGVSKVICASSESYLHQLAENVAPLIVELAPG